LKDSKSPNAIEVQIDGKTAILFPIKRRLPQNKPRKRRLTRSRNRSRPVHRVNSVGSPLRCDRGRSDPAQVTENDDAIYRHARLGGTLNFYYRKAA
jgi:hypothetical protein